MSDKRIPFTKEDEARIASAGLWGIIVAVITILAALADTALEVRDVLAQTAPAHRLIGQGVALLIYLLLGIWLIQASLDFRKVALTDIADKAYFLHGFRKLFTYFKTTGILMVLLIVGILALAAFSVVFSMADLMSHPVVVSLDIF